VTSLRSVVDAIALLRGEWPPVHWSSSIRRSGRLERLRGVLGNGQRLKSQYFACAGSEPREKLELAGALSLYRDLINLFQPLLNFMREPQRA
jgi:hypothetical protein